MENYCEKSFLVRPREIVQKVMKRSSRGPEVDLEIDSPSISFPLTSETGLSFDDERFYLRSAFYVCVGALVITIVSGFVGITVGVINHSSAFLAFGMDGAVDILAGSFIIWRFSGPVNSPDQLMLIESKENRASVAIAFALISVCFITAVQAIVHLIQSDPPNNDTLLFIVSGSLGGLLLCAALFKFWIAFKLKSLALKESGVTNISGFFLAGGVIVANGAYLSDTSVWFLDPVFAIVISCVILGFGMYTLIAKRRSRWWRKFFWCPVDVEHQ